VADFVLANAERVMHMSVSEAACDVGVGEATVVRFCRALGYRGYQEFKLRLARAGARAAGWRCANPREKEGHREREDEPDDNP
jgi:DNA-binding MurR/RpiR family transcriptional regulator